MGDDFDNDYDDPRDRIVSELEEVHSTLNEIHSTLKSKLDFTSIVWIVFVILLLGDWSGSKLDRWTDKVWYSFRFNTDFKNVSVDKRPSDCDFLHSPLGGKGCEYKKRTDVFRDEQRRELIGQATTPQEAQDYSTRPNSVTVYWEKVDE